MIDGTCPHCDEVAHRKCGLDPSEAKALRERLELTQRGFAKLVGVDQVTVNRWEHRWVKRITGAPAQVMRGLIGAMNQLDEKKMSAYLRESVAGGGLPHMMIDLFDNLLEKR